MTQQARPQKAQVSRWNKATGETKTYRDINKAIEQYMRDFNITTAQTAKLHIFSLLTDPDVYYIQNAIIAWMYEGEPA